MKSPKAKGSRLERVVAGKIRHKELDKDARRMPLSGGFSHLPGDIYTRLPYSFECKNQERIKLWDFWAQATGQCPMGQDPVLVISSNHRPILAVVDIELFLNLLKIERDYLADVPQRTEVPKN